MNIRVILISKESHENEPLVTAEFGLVLVREGQEWVHYTVLVTLEILEEVVFVVLHVILVNLHGWGWPEQLR